jgi:hypothetical protein
MPELHNLSKDVYGVTNLSHVAGIGVNAGFIIISDTIVHIDSGMTSSDEEPVFDFAEKLYLNREI